MISFFFRLKVLKVTSYSISASLWNEKKEGKMYIFLVNLIVERQNIKKTLYKLPVPIFNSYYKKDLLASFPTPSAPLATKTTTPLVKAICSTTEIEWRHKMLWGPAQDFLRILSSRLRHLPSLSEVRAFSTASQAPFMQFPMRMNLASQEGRDVTASVKIVQVANQTNVAFL